MQLRKIFRQNKSFGFTLVELVTVVALFSTLLVLGLFMSGHTLMSTLVRSDRATVGSFLQHARSRSLANVEQSAWGVCYLAPNYVVFKGTLCAQSAVVESTEANPSVAGASDFAHTFPAVVFTQLSGTTTPAVITLVQNNLTITLTLNYEGTIIW